MNWTNQTFKQLAERAGVARSLEAYKKNRKTRGNN